MLYIEATLERRRRRGQNEISVLVREFSESSLSQKKFALKFGVHPLIVARWVESCSGKSAHRWPRLNGKRAVVNMVPNPM
ncbi:MAG: hypothetical protein RLZZ245_1405 [Verrucomicrobiota bacterium]